MEYSNWLNLKDEICLTFDVDWAPDETIRPIIDLLESLSLRATFFATHESKLLNKLNPELFEVGIHPNFNNAQKDHSHIVRDLKMIYPNAVGQRSHSLHVSSRILKACAELGFLYESNIFLPFHEHIHPVKRFRNLYSIPIFWSDDKHIELEDRFDSKMFFSQQPGLKVLNFHPMHIFMNTWSEDHYASYKPYYQDPDSLKGLINRTKDGAGTMFSTLVEELRVHQNETHTMSQICKTYISYDNS